LSTEEEFDLLKKRYLRLRKGIVTQVWFHSIDAGPLPSESAYKALEQAREKLQECYIRLKAEREPARQREREIRRAAAEARRRMT